MTDQEYIAVLELFLSEADCIHISDDQSCLSYGLDDCACCYTPVATIHHRATVRELFELWVANSGRYFEFERDKRPVSD